MKPENHFFFGAFFPCGSCDRASLKIYNKKSSHSAEQNLRPEEPPSGTIALAAVPSWVTSFHWQPSLEALTLLFFAILVAFATAFSLLLHRKGMENNGAKSCQHWEPSNFARKLNLLCTYGIFGWSSYIDVIRCTVIKYVTESHFKSSSAVCHLALRGTLGLGICISYTGFIFDEQMQGVQRIHNSCGNAQHWLTIVKNMKRSKTIYQQPNFRDIQAGTLVLINCSKRDLPAHDPVEGSRQQTV